MKDGTRFKPYPRYKDSGVEWLGRIPETWDVQKLKLLADCLDGRRVPLNSAERATRRGEYPYWGANGIVDYLNEWLFDEELVLLGEDGAPFFEPYKTVAFFVRGKIWVNNHAHVLRPAKTALPSFLTYALNCAEYRAFIDGSTRDKLTQDDMRNIPIQLPSFPEQRAIAEFLDRETTKIDELIAKKERLIELLEEKRAALITHAVTRGLNPDAPLRDSGVEWLGQIPAHWKIKRLKHILQRPLEYGASETSEHSNLDWPRFIRITDLNDDGSLRDDSFRSLPPNIAEHYLILPGDLLFARSGATVGKSFLYRGADTKKACFAGYLIRAAINRNEATPDFIWFFTRSNSYRSWLTRVAIQATIQNISAERYSNLCIPIPPSSEQGEIAAGLNAEMATLDRLVLKVKTAIASLQEYRAALITAAVTGTIDVRDEVEATA